MEEEDYKWIQSYNRYVSNDCCTKHVNDDREGHDLDPANHSRTLLSPLTSRAIIMVLNSAAMDIEWLYRNRHYVCNQVFTKPFLFCVSIEIVAKRSACTVRIRSLTRNSRLSVISGLWLQPHSLSVKLYGWADRNEAALLIGYGSHCSQPGHLGSFVRGPNTRQMDR